MTEDLITRLRACAEDPMWAHHAEVPKALLSAAAAELERLTAERDALLVDTEMLHVSVCQAVALLNCCPEAARIQDVRLAHAALRHALVAYADVCATTPKENKA
jgi:hypothetical protein